jgi:hypothetical protein
MGISWEVIEAHHVAKACDLLAADRERGSAGGGGLFVRRGDALPPAKAVAKTAFLLATKQPLDTFLDFTSGETLLVRLRGLGCDAVRLPGVGKIESL